MSFAASSVFFSLLVSESMKYLKKIYLLTCSVYCQCYSEYVSVDSNFGVKTTKDFIGHGNSIPFFLTLWIRVVVVL